MKTNFSLILLAIALVLAGCSELLPGRAAGDRPPDPPDVVVQHFYNWYLDETQAAPKDARRSGVLSEDLAAKIEASRSSDHPVAIVTFVCAQDFPESVSVGAASIEGDRAIVPVETSWGGRLEIGLLESENGWLIDNVQCTH